MGVRPRVAHRKVGRGLDEAPKRGWILVDMKQDWKMIYKFQNSYEPLHEP